MPQENNYIEPYILNQSQTYNFIRKVIKFYTWDLTRTIMLKFQGGGVI